MMESGIGNERFDAAVYVTPEVLNLLHILTCASINIPQLIALKLVSLADKISYESQNLETHELAVGDEKCRSFTEEGRNCKVYCVLRYI